MGQYDLEDKGERLAMPRNCCAFPHVSPDVSYAFSFIHYWRIFIPRKIIPRENGLCRRILDDILSIGKRLCQTEVQIIRDYRGQ